MEAPDFIVACLGQFERFDALERIAKDATGGLFTLDKDFSRLEADDRMPDAFEASYDRSNDTMSKKDWRAVEAHRAVAYFIVRKVPDTKRVSTMLRALDLVDALIAAKLATAIKCDSCGIAHGIKEWTRLAGGARNATADARQLLCYQAWVRKPLEDDELLYSCGMHLFGQPDFVTREGDARKALALFERAFRATQLAEAVRPEPKLKAKKKLEVYPKDHLYFNKYGYLEIVQD